MSKLPKQYENMKIEHTTYEQCHRGGLPTHPLPSTSTLKREKYLPSEKYSDQHFLLNPGTDENPTLWPHAKLPSPPDTPPQMTTYTTHRHRRERHKGERKEEKRKGVSASKSSVNCLPLRRSNGMKIETSPAKSEHTLRRVPKMEPFGGPRSLEPKKPCNKPETVQIYTVRDAIRAGKLERVIPPPAARREEKPLAPPRQHFAFVSLPTVNASSPKRMPLENPNPPTMRSSNNRGTLLDTPRPPKSPKTPKRSNRHKRTSSSRSSKIGQYIEDGIDVLDELAGKFSAPFEHISFSRHRKSRDDESEMSFFCIGEPELTQTSQGPQKKASPDPSRGLRRRLSGEGTNPWTHPPPAACRLCRKPGVRGVRGICDDCERAFMRPKTQNLGSEDEDEIKPTPPLKDYVVLSKGQRDIQRKPVPPSEDGTKGQRKANLKLVSVGHRPQFVTPAPSHQRSLKGLVEGGDDNEERWRTWQAPVMRDEYGKPRETYKKRSDCCEKDERDSYERDDQGSIFIEQKGQRNGHYKERNTQFYGFYDEVLIEHGGKPSRR